MRNCVPETITFSPWLQSALHRVIIADRVTKSYGTLLGDRVPFTSVAT